METKLSIISIIIEDIKKVDQVNQILHENPIYTIGRLGVPYHKKNICVLSIVLDCPPDFLSSLSGKLGMLEGVSVKSMSSKI
ncbi:MAG: iron-only hydrogenase system regulator [Eubacteriales bacterium]|nr:iron-only hydrogenase system regulator [Eubacteriales bacterium]